MQERKREYISKTSPVTGIRWVWEGGHGIHGYIGKEEVAFFNIGSWTKESATPSEARKAIKRVAYLPAKEQKAYAIYEYDR